MDPFSLDHIFPLPQYSVEFRTCARASLHVRTRVCSRGYPAQAQAPRLLTLGLSGAKWTDLAFVLLLSFSRVVKEHKVTCGDPGRGDAPLVGLVRVELTTSRLSGVRSNHLSYRPR